MSLELIHDSIPHRAPMLLVEEIVEHSKNFIHGRKTFRADEFFVQGHYPTFALVPGVILCEAAMQTGAILLKEQFAGKDDKIPVVAKISDARFKHMVRPGDTVDIEVTLDESLSRAFYLSGKVTVDGKLAVRLDFTCMAAPNPEHAAETES